MTVLRQAIDAAAEALADAGVESPRADAELLAAHAAGVERGRLGFFDAGPDFFERYGGLVAERVTRKPLQHIVGTAAFGPVTVEVGPGVFIPRPETESMLEWSVAQPLPHNPVIVDLCTGTGALAFALSKNWPDARIVAVDDSENALKYADRNLATTGVELDPGGRHRTRSAARTRRPCRPSRGQPTLYSGRRCSGTRSGRT